MHPADKILERLLKIAQIEFADIVNVVLVVNYKLRFVLKEWSYIDVGFSKNIPALQTIPHAVGQLSTIKEDAPIIYIDHISAVYRRCADSPASIGPKFKRSSPDPGCIPLGQ